jgi:CubicO group peptidase (beta-lactamase class C family)
MTLSLLLVFAEATTSLAQSTAPAAVRPASSLPERMSEADTIAAVKAELARRVATDQFSGTVLIAKAGKPIFQQAYGEADREKRIPNTLDTKFRFGSMGKMFTAVSIMQLAQAGKVKLDDPISRFLPDYPNKDVAAVTVHQLLTHTGGTGDIFGPEFDAHRLELREHKDYVALYGNRGVRFAPGSRWEYSNYGMVLLGRIIEVVSGESYFDYVRNHVAKPTGMDSTDNLPEDRHVQNLSVTYTRLVPGERLTSRTSAQLPQEPVGPLHPSTDNLPYSGTSAGGGYSTVGDFLKFATALASNKLLNAHYSQLVITGKVDTPRGVKYAYGFEDELTSDGVRRVGHGGGSSGMNGMLSIYPASQYVVVVLANRDPPAAQEVAQFIGNRLPAK